VRHKLIKKERAALKAKFPMLTLCPDGIGGGRVTGVLQVVDGIGYTVNLMFSKNYPDEVPRLFCRKEEIDWKADRHVYPDSDGMACLCVASEYRKHWPPSSTLADFLDVLVWPYFVGQAYYEAHGHWLDGGDRPHGPEGIFEAYKELLGPLDMDHATIIGFMKLIARPNHSKGTMECPCGSGLLLRRCHGTLVAHIRRMVDYRHAAHDLKFVQSHSDCNQDRSVEHKPAQQCAVRQHSR